VKLVYGTKADLESKYPGVGDTLPSVGVGVDKSFIAGNTEPSNDNEGAFIDGSIASRYASVRFLLQSRKLSQTMVYTWLDDDRIPAEKRSPIEQVRYVFRTYNIKPKTCILENEQERPLATKQLLRGTDDASQSDQVRSNNLAKISEKPKEDTELLDWLGKLGEAKKSKLSYLVQPTSQSYYTIRLMLLLSGQAYYELGEGDAGYKPGETRYGRTWEPIYSTYEIIWEYGIDVSWDTCYASRIDVSQSGYGSRPPYSIVTLGYPPKPSDSTVTQAQISQWAKAPDVGGDFPFYPNTEKERDDWDKRTPKHVTPPSPYMPVSCS
jgi:hypothetical protein